MGAAALAFAGSASAYTPCPEQVVFWGDDGTFAGLWRMNEDGSGVTFIQPTNNLQYPSITPDANQIVYGWGTLNVTSIYGGAGTNVFNQYPDASAEFPRVGPDGTTVAFSSVLLSGDRDTTGGNIHTVQTDGTGLRDVVDWVSLQDAPDISPDGTRIALESEGTPGGAELNDKSQLDTTGQIIPHPELFVTDANGGNPQQLTSVGEFTRAEFPKFSPDGTTIAFEGVQSGGGAAGIFVMSAGGGGATFIADGQNPEWAPDGRSIIYSRSGFLRRVGADGSGDGAITLSPSAPQAFYPVYRHPSTTVGYTAPDCEQAPPPPPPPGGSTGSNSGSGAGAGSSSSAASTSTGNPSATNTTTSTAAKALAANKGGPKGDPLYRQPH